MSFTLSTAVSTLLQHLIHPLDLHFEFPLTRYHNEHEPNNTRQQADHLGVLYPNMPIHVSGHINGSSDPHDYFDFSVSEPGFVVVATYNGNNLVKDEVFQAHQANESFSYYVSASGNTSFNYDTSITLNTHVTIA